MPKTVLYYFPAKALGEAIRLLLAYSGQEFEDHRIKFEDWGSFKSLMPFGQMPVLEIDGKKYAQSTAIARYLGQKNGLAGDNLEESFEIDQNIEFLIDIRDEAAEVHYEKDVKLKATKYEDNLKNKYPAMLKKLDEIIKQNKGHIAAGKLTWGDFVFAGSFDYMKVMLRMPDLEKKYPSFKQVIDAVYADEKVRTYSEKCPKTEF
nr:glutathione S-transferase 2-like [Vanessa tameamea]